MLPCVEVPRLKREFRNQSEDGKISNSVRKAEQTNGWELEEIINVQEISD